MLSRLVAGKPLGSASAAPASQQQQQQQQQQAGGSAGGGAAANGVAAPAAAPPPEGRKAAAARAAAADGLAPLLPGLTALAALSGCRAQYSEWLVLALESAGLSSAAPGSPDELVLRSASNVVACLCGNEACFGLWEAKHKGGLRGSARVLAALLRRPELLGPLQQAGASKAAFRRLLAALPARHRAHLAAGKGWQGACARVAEDACAKLPRKLGGRLGVFGGGGGGGARGAGGVGSVMAVLGLGSVVGGIMAVGGLYRREVAGVVAAYAGKDTAQQLDGALLRHLEAGMQQGLAAAQPLLQQLQVAAGPAAAAAWAQVGPLWQAAQQQVVAPALAEGQKLAASLAQQLQELAAAKAKAA
jgi:hypothetical protein